MPEQFNDYYLRDLVESFVAILDASKEEDSNLMDQAKDEAINALRVFKDELATEIAKRL